jgi:hypothetical protein
MACRFQDLPEFNWIKAVLDNLKIIMAGAIKALKYRKCAQTYLGAFAYRFNHRFDLRDMVVRLVVDAARTRPVPKSDQRQAC